LSMFLNSSADTLMFSILDMNDERICMPSSRWNVWDRSAQLRPWEDGMLWPSSRLMWGDSSQGANLFGNDAATINRFESISNQTDETGGQGRLKIRGFTQDGTGAALGSCLIQGFINSNDVYVGQCVSDGGGYYEFCSQYSGQAHYLVAYKPGSPDVAGTTVNTLVPS